MLASTLVLLCYRTDSETTLENLKSHWLPLVDDSVERSSTKKHKPLIVVACQNDLEGEGDESAIAALATETGAAHFVSTSVKDGTGIEALTEAIAIVGLSFASEMPCHL